ncbi:MAG: type II secretion system protein GspD, partial [Kiritimatiellae bacterium]|nr:type II secretion system protein GspD [Kiritimatiellia bacterium]
PALATAIALLPLLPQCAAAQDPTQPTAAMAEAIRARIADSSDLAVRGLVVGADGEGVAIVGSGAASSGVPVRAGSVINHDAGGIGVPLRVKSVSAAGVLMESGGGDGENWFLPGSFAPLPAPQNGAEDPELLRHVEFSRVPLAEALRLLSDRSGVNISASAATEKVPVSIFLRNVGTESAVEEICRATGLWFRRDSASGIIRVTTMAEYEESLATFREERTESYTLLYPNVLEVASVIYGLYPERVMLSLGEDEILDGEKDDISRRFERFDTIAGNGGSAFMKMDPGASSGVGGSSSSGVLTFNGGRVSMVPSVGRLSAADASGIRASAAASGADAAKAVEEAEAEFRARSANIFVTVSRKNSMLMVRTSDARAMDDIRALVRRLDVPTPMVLLEVRVLELQDADEFNSSFEYEVPAREYHRDGGAHTTGVSARSAKAGFPGFNPLSSEARSDAMSFQVLSWHLNARIQLLEKEGKAKTLATPLLLTANNEVSRLFIGEERPMVRAITSQTIANGDTTITVPQTEIELQSVGTMLLITPNINADRTVTLRLLQENSEISEGAATIPIYSATDGGIVQNVPVDVVSSRSVTGTFVASDGMTTAVGGLIKEVESEEESRIPILGRLPLLGWLFRSTERVKKRTELIVMVTPHVISTPQEGHATSARVVDALSSHPARDGRPSMGVLKNAAEP